MYTLGRSIVWTAGYINWTPRQKMGGCGFVSSGSGQGPVVVSYELANKFSGSTKQMGIS